MAIQSLVEIEGLLPHLICPYCYHCDLDAVLRCDLGWRDACLPTVRCGHCGHMFNPDTNWRALEAIRQVVLAEPITMECLACGSRFTDTLFRCTLADHDCSYVVKCHACGAVQRLRL